MRWTMIFKTFQPGGAGQIEEDLAASSPKHHSAGASCRAQQSGWCISQFCTQDIRLVVETSTDSKLDHLILHLVKIILQCPSAFDSSRLSETKMSRCVIPNSRRQSFMSSTEMLSSSGLIDGTKETWVDFAATSPTGQILV